MIAEGRSFFDRLLVIIKIKGRMIMSLERKNEALRKKNAKLQEQVDDLQLRLLEREEELDGEELREEYLSLINEFHEIMDDVRETQREYECVIKDIMDMKKKFEKELFRYNPVMFFKVKMKRK